MATKTAHPHQNLKFMKCVDARPANGVRQRMVALLGM
jgi:hypothetical protein